MKVGKFPKGLYLDALGASIQKLEHQSNGTFRPLANGQFLPLEYDCNGVFWPLEKPFLAFPQRPFSAVFLDTTSMGMDVEWPGEMGEREEFSVLKAVRGLGAGARRKKGNDFFQNGRKETKGRFSQYK